MRPAPVPVHRRARRCSHGSHAMPSPRVRVYLADAHPLFIAGVARAVRGRAAFALAGAATCAEQAMTDLRRLRPDVALIDACLRGGGARQILDVARCERLPTRIVVLTAELAESLVYELLAAGAAGYLSKAAGREAILDAVAAAARGEIVLSPGVQTGLVHELRR